MAWRNAWKAWNQCCCKHRRNLCSVNQGGGLAWCWWSSIAFYSLRGKWLRSMILCIVQPHVILRVVPISKLRIKLGIKARIVKFVRQHLRWQKFLTQFTTLFCHWAILGCHEGHYSWRKQSVPPCQQSPALSQGYQSTRNRCDVA